MKPLLIALFLLASFTSQAQFVVVVPKDSPIQSLSEREVMHIFMAKTNRFPDGTKTSPMELTDANQRSAFYQSISGKSLAQINSYWTTVIFTGKGKPPKKIDGENRLLEMLKSNPRAISYVRIDQVDPALRVVHELR